MSHQIWVIVDDKGKINQCWEAEHPVDADNPDMPPIELDNMPVNWQRLKIPEPSDFKEIKDKAKEKKKSISAHIFDDYEVDVKNKKLKKRKKDE